MRRILFLAAVSLVFALAGAPAKAATLYKFAFTGGSGATTASGYFEIDTSVFAGNPSTPISASNIVALNFTATYAGGTESWTTADVKDSALISFFYSAGIPQVQSTSNNPLARNAAGYTLDVSCCRAFDYSFPNGLNQLSGTWTTTLEVIPTPLPAALPLFVSGVAALGAVAWRRRRKPKAA